MTDASILWCTAGLNVVAVIAAPVTALWIQRKGDHARARRERRDQIFKTLWVNRSRHFYVQRIDALNMIDVEFFGEAKILDAWQDLFAHYCKDHPELSNSQITTARDEKYATLLYEMSQVLGYTFGRTHIRDNIYRPVLHGQFDEMEFETRKLFLNLLKGDALPVRLVDDPAHDDCSTANVREEDSR